MEGSPRDALPTPTHSPDAEVLALDGFPPSASSWIDSGATTAGSVQNAERPEPGLARGLWEAPPWFFWTVAALTVITGAAYATVRIRRALARGAPRRGGKKA
ncbi:MAG: hypothetical protein ABSF69_29520 [Polyangiaceae bacterium]